MTPVLVPDDFVMDPEKHYLLFSGDRLKTGMRVLIEDGFVRRYHGELEDLHQYERERALKNARWCRVGEIEIVQRRDEFGVPTSPLVAFEARYDDGTSAKRSFDASYAWFVQKPAGEYAEVVRDGVRQACPWLNPEIFD